MSAIKKRITQKQIAALAKITPDFLNHILRGRRPCPKRVALRLETVTGISRNTWIWSTPEEMRRALDRFMYPQRGQHGP